MRHDILFPTLSVDIGQPFAGLRQLANNWLKRQRLRRLEDLDDRLLDDIGVTRDEVTAALRLPLAVDPVGELNRRSRARRVRGQRGR